MSKPIPAINDDLASWLSEQRLFFVATAPLSAEGHINCSPKGGDSFRVLGPMEVAYQDYTGSGAETIAHLRENGRILLMFCAFDGPPQIIRLHGTGTAYTLGHPQFEELNALFPANPGTRAIIKVQVERVSTSCGYSVPFFDYREPREMLDNWATKQGDERLATYRQNKNSTSLDGLPAFAEGERLSG